MIVQWGLIRLRQGVSDEILHDEILRDEILHDEILHDEILHDEILHDEILHDEILHDEILHDEILHDEILHDEILRDEILRDEILHDEILHSFVNVAYNLVRPFRWRFILKRLKFKIIMLEAKRRSCNQSRTFVCDAKVRDAGHTISSNKDVPEVFNFNSSFPYRLMMSNKGWCWGV